VGDEEEGDPDLIVNLVEVEKHSLTELEIEGGKGFVEEKNLGTVDDRPCDRDPLLLTSRDMRRTLVRVVLHLDQIKGPVDGTVPLGATLLRHPKTEGDVLPNRHVREEGIALKDRVDRAPLGGNVGDVFSVEDDPPRIGRLETGNHAEERRLAAAGRTQQTEHLSLANIEGHLAHRGVVAEELGDLLEM
jgi:hypothetical protein